MAGIGQYCKAGPSASSDAGPTPAPPPRPTPDPAVRPAPAPSLPGCGGKQTLTSKVLWAMHCVESHYSFHSCEGIVDLFKLMFPGHPVAETFSCGETKCRYLCQFGLAPHFSSLLKSRLNKDSEYVLFDESMNSKTKNKQLDLHVRLAP